MNEEQLQTHSEAADDAADRSAEPPDGSETPKEQTPPPQDAEGAPAPVGTEPAEAPSVKLRLTRGQIARKWVLSLLAIIAAGCIRALAVHCFILPGQFAPGGVTGISTMLEFATGWSSGIFLFGINIPLIIVAFLFVHRNFAVKTSVSIVVSSLLLFLMKQWRFPTIENWGGLAGTGDRMLAALAGGVLSGAGVAVLLKTGGSTGGSDIIATIIQKKYSATNISWFIFALDSVVVVVSVFVYKNGITPVLLSLIAMFASSKVVEMILQGFKSAIKFEIVTEHPEELSRELIQKLHRGVTMVSATGMYTHGSKAMLICIVRKRQMSQVRNILKKYPDTFAHVVSASEVVGHGFS